jgi:hypothetical protein
MKNCFTTFLLSKMIVHNHDRWICQLEWWLLVPIELGDSIHYVAVIWPHRHLTSLCNIETSTVVSVMFTFLAKCHCFYHNNNISPLRITQLLITALFSYPRKWVLELGQNWCLSNHVHPIDFFFYLLSLHKIWSIVLRVCNITYACLRWIEISCTG